MRRGHGGARCSARRSCAGVTARVWGLQDERMRAQGFHGGQLKAGRGSRAGVPWRARARISPGSSGSVGALEKERRKEGDDRWTRERSERGGDAATRVTR